MRNKSLIIKLLQTIKNKNHIKIAMLFMKQSKNNEQRQQDTGAIILLGKTRDQTIKKNATKKTCDQQALFAYT